MMRGALQRYPARMEIPHPRRLRVLLLEQTRLFEDGEAEDVVH